MVKARHSKKLTRKMTTSKKRKMTTRKYKHRGGGAIKDAFLNAIKNPPAGERKSYTSFESFFEKESSREKQTLKNKDGVIFTFWISGVRPIHFVVEKDGKEEIVGSVSD
jgi:hypothetical protein